MTGGSRKRSHAGPRTTATSSSSGGALSAAAVKRSKKADTAVAGPSTAGSTPRSAQRRKPTRRPSTSSYLDEADSDFSDEEGFRRNFSVEEKLASPRFPQYQSFFVVEMGGEASDLEAHFHRSGFNTPILVRGAGSVASIGLTVPDAASFTVSDVKNLVGAKRILDVMDCSTQKDCQMTMKDWEEYYNSTSGSSSSNHGETGESSSSTSGMTEKRGGKLLNVISLEFSHTKMEALVEAPKIVRQLDWIDHIWPRHLKEEQTEGTNDLREMKYPKVQKYCLMSVAGCYTDFHIDFGGTSVWYHILRGKKIFWLIPPTEANLKAYEQWTLSGKQGDVFFGDLVEKCGMVTLEAGVTFFIPSGWIHAVHTSEDSLVFGGNFLHSYAIDKQIRVAQIEETTKVPHKFRFPFFTELQWYALDKYVYGLLGRSHLEFSEDLKRFLIGTEAEHRHFVEQLQSNKPAITPRELFGLKTIVMYLHALPISKKNVPASLKHPINLIRDIRTVVNEHKDDTLEQAMSRKMLLAWPGIKNDRSSLHSSHQASRSRAKSGSGSAGHHRKAKDQGLKRETLSSTSTTFFKTEQNCVERLPCKVCQACVNLDCGKCDACADMIKFGGLGRLRKNCLRRKCIQPLLPLSVVCEICGLDGWFAEQHMRLVDRPPGTCALMECCICKEITHPTCSTDYGVDGFIKMDLPNSWECPRCIKIREDAKKLAKFVKEEVKQDPPTSIEGAPGAVVHQCSSQQGPSTPLVHQPDPLRKPIASGMDASTAGSYELFSVRGTSDHAKLALRTQLADQIVSATTETLKSPKYILRPPPQLQTADSIWERRRKHQRLKSCTETAKRDDGLASAPLLQGVDDDTPVDLRLEPLIMLPVFRMLNTLDLGRCAGVCRAWTRILQDPSLWSFVRIDNEKVNSRMLSLIVQRQPISLSLNCCKISKLQLNWLLPRIPQTRAMSLVGLDYLSTISVMNTVNAPMLQELDLSFVTSLNDSAVFRLLSSPRDSRPGLLDKKSRLKMLQKLRLCGTEISDISLRYVSQYLHLLKVLDVSGCHKLSNDGLAQLALPEAKIAESLASLSVAGCKLVSDSGILSLSRCKSLTHLDCTGTKVTPNGAKQFVASSTEKLKICDGPVINKHDAS